MGAGHVLSPSKAQWVRRAMSLAATTCALAAPAKSQTPTPDPAGTWIVDLPESDIDAAKHWPIDALRIVHTAPLTYRVSASFSTPLHLRRQGGQSQMSLSTTDRRIAPEALYVAVEMLGPPERRSPANPDTTVDQIERTFSRTGDTLSVDGDPVKLVISADGQRLRLVGFPPGIGSSPCPYVSDNDYGPDVGCQRAHRLEHYRADAGAIADSSSTAPWPGRSVVWTRAPAAH
jgi:hypothetical protein